MKSIKCRFPQLFLYAHALCLSEYKKAPAADSHHLYSGLYNTVACLCPG